MKGRRNRYRHDRACGRLWMSRHEEGPGLAEYALLLALIAIVAIAALLFLGGQVSTGSSAQ